MKILPAAFLVAIALILPSCSGPYSAETAPARRILDGMTDDDKLGQVIMASVWGNGNPDAAARDLVSTLKPGGIVLFGFNASAGPEETRILTASLQDSLPAGSPAILFAIDHEGGGVWRFGPELSRLPPAKELGAVAQASDLEELGAIAGKELRALGIGLNLAPVVEPLSPWNQSFMGRRCYSSDPDKAADFAASFARGLAGEGVGACYKHFPANGEGDPHEGEPRLGAGAEELARYGLEPFSRAIRAEEPAAVMLSHVVIEALDPERPASLSPKVIGGLKGLGYGGIVLTDDVLMAALLKDRSPGDAALLALNAGADMVMVASSREAPGVKAHLASALKAGTLSRGRLDDACLRILRVKLSLGLERERDPLLRAKAFEGLPRSVESGRKYIRSLMAKADN